jgi:hypothetical protein
MISKKELKQIESIRKEISYFENKLKKLNEKPVKVVLDSVQASSVEFPYTRHTAKIEGFENKRNLNKYKKIIKSRQYELEKALIHLEYELNNIEDSELRRIIRYRYKDNYSWVKIMHIMNFESEEAPRLRLKRFLEKK